ncbi:MAG: hypothetical protein M1826_003322 [Phylliscum demangeonii]|nr:MAG: hypothetical protein M1826_003322 [Phylliscum demangeonii]
MARAKEDPDPDPDRASAIEAQRAHARQYASHEQRAERERAAFILRCGNELYAVVGRFIPEVWLAPGDVHARWEMAAVAAAVADAEAQAQARRLEEEEGPDATGGGGDDANAMDWEST